METPFFFNNINQKRLFGILHSVDAQDDATQKNIAVIYCHPLFEEYQLSHRVSVNFARNLTAHGYSVLRFNYFGDGESDGLFEDASVESRVGDIKSAIAEIQSRLKPEKIFLLGLRTGATLGLIAAENCKEIDGLICWSPILNMGEFVYNLLRENMSTQIAVHKKVICNREKMIEQINQGCLIDIKGYNLGNPFYKQALEIDFTKRMYSNSMCSLFVQMSNINKIEKQLDDFKTAHESHDLTIKIVNEQKMWVPQKMIFPPYNDLFSTTLSWIKEKASN